MINLSPTPEARWWYYLGLKCGYKLYQNLTVYATELFAILKALEWIKVNKPDHVVILTDSLRSIQRIDSGKKQDSPGPA